jgi:hypothetical protein
MPSILILKVLIYCCLAFLRFFKAPNSYLNFIINMAKEQAKVMIRITYYLYQNNQALMLTSWVPQMS